MDDKIKQKLQKILRLAREGVGGEKVNAQSMLDRLLKKHGMSMADIEDTSQEVSLHEFKYKSALEAELLYQLCYSFLQTNRLKFSKPPYQKNRVWIEMTRSQAAEVTFLFSMYCAELKKEMRKTMWALCVANDLLGPRPSEEDKKKQSKSKEDFSGVHSRARSMEPVQVRKAIEGSK